MVPPLTSDTDGDCDDGNPNVNPDAVEVCNGRDDDCDGLTDDADPGLDPDSTETFHVDADGDGWGGEDEVFACELPDGAAALMGDCDDRAPAVFPGAPELCNGIDDDCDGRTDDEDEVAVGNPGLFIDADGDGVGSVEAVACAVGDGVVDVSGDCNDADATVYPGAVDECGGGDNDCDGLIDEDGTPLEWYIDADGDGFGDEVVLACEPPEGTVVFAGDCDDSDPTRYPGAPEVPDDGIDQDCDGLDAAGAPGPSTGTRTIPEDELEAPRAPAQPDPGCACDTRGGPTPALAALGALFALRRRPRRS
jgi:MYXO-CTERM domain-containing protein